MKTTSVTQYLKDNISKQMEFFRGSKCGDILVYIDYPGFNIEKYMAIENELLSFHADVINNTLTEQIIEERAFDLGVAAVRYARALAAFHYDTVGDVFCPCVMVNWGVGCTTAMITGGEVHFEKGTSYTRDHLIKTWNDLDKFRFCTDNKWIDYVIEFWRGVETQELDGLAFMPTHYRSPLDLANDLRGDTLFIDLYDNTEAVGSLLNLCTDCIITVDKILRQEIKTLKTHPGGTWGTILPPGAVFLNGDPIDLISAEMGEQFNNPYAERIIDYSGSCFFHHHSIGASRAKSVAKIRGLTVQEIYQDPNGPRLCDVIDGDIIDASRRVPIQLDFNLIDFDTKYIIDELIAFVHKLMEGRFILRLKLPNEIEYSEITKKLQKAMNG